MKRRLPSLQPNANNFQIRTGCDNESPSCPLSLHASRRVNETPAAQPATKCEQLPECTSDEDCSAGLICKVLPTGLKACQPKSTEVEQSNIHECGRSSECETKDKLGMICKEDENKIRTCVRPFKCLRRGRCLGNELCDINNECRAPLECSATQKCPTGQTCQEHKPGNPKSCHPDLTLPVPDTLEECDTTQDCIKEGGEERVCKVVEKGEKRNLIHDLLSFPMHPHALTF